MSDHSDHVLHEMLERSTERARRVLFFARMEVSEWGSAHIEPEHILLGIIREGQGAAYQLLFEKFRLDRRALADEIGSRMDRQPTFAESIEIPFSAATRGARGGRRGSGSTLCTDDRHGALCFGNPSSARLSPRLDTLAVWSESRAGARAALVGGRTH